MRAIIPRGPKDARVRIHGKSQGYKGLPCRHSNLSDGRPCFMVAYEFDEADKKKIAEDGKLYINFIGFNPQPMLPEIISADQALED